MWRIACHCGSVWRSDSHLDVCPNCRTPVNATPERTEFARSVYADLDQIETTPYDELPGLG
jgi:hypothetical protein